MKRGALLLVLLAVGAAWCLPAMASAKVRYAGHVRYTTTQCCNFQTAAFKVFGRSDVRYRVCMIRPSGYKKCRNLRTGRSGQPSITRFLGPEVGMYRILWKVEGKVRDTASYYVEVEGV